MDYGIDGAVISSMEEELEHLRKQLKAVKRAIKKRQELSEQILSDLESKISFYRSIQNDSLALSTYSHGNSFEEMREHVRALIRDLEERKRFERIKAWNDVQDLMKEERALERELKKMEKSYRFMLDLLRKLG